MKLENSNAECGKCSTPSSFFRFPDWRACSTAGCLLVGLLPLTGCESLGKAMTVKNPVVPPPPQRVANLLPPSSADVGHAYVDDPVFGEAPQGEIVQTGLVESAAQSESLPSGEVAALVNGVPIFVDDVLEPFNADLFKAAKEVEKTPPGHARQLKQQQLRQARQHLVKSNIKPHIERQLLITALKSKLKDEQFKGLDKHLDSQFDEEIVKMMKVFGVSTLAELDVELAKNGSSVESQRAKFKNQRMAQQYFAFKMQKPAVDRADILAYYQSHLEDYEYPGQVRWQQISLRFEDQGGKEKTRALARKIVGSLEKGTDFAVLAKKYSSGGTAQTGGMQDWTRAGSFADSQVETVLFELPEGQISPPLENDAGIQIVRLIEKKLAGRKSFESVQDEIKEALRESEFRASAGTVLRELYDNATIELKFENNADRAERSAS